MNLETVNYPLYPLSEPIPRNFAITQKKTLCLCYNPTQIKKAYGINSKSTGKGKKIALIEAYSHPNLQSNLDVFCEKFNLTKTTLQIVDLYKNLPTNTSWSIEAATDTQWSHALAEDAEILVVCAKTNQYPDLFEAANYAVANGADIVSMSFGTEEFETQTKYSSLFENPNVIFVASSGDIGGSVFFPSSSPYVISVGGTTLALTKSGIRIGEETAWEFSGGGPSLYIEMPEYQKVFENIQNLAHTKRATPDIAFLADPTTGVAVYYNDNNAVSENGWQSVGGTSVGAPCIAAIIAISNTKGKNFPQELYNLAGSPKYQEPQYSFNDIILGSNGIYSTLYGYDLCTGLGTPRRIFD